jgi:hypothetical protein
LAMLIYVTIHFFGDIKTIFSGITDRRDPRKVSYKVALPPNGRKDLCKAMFSLGERHRLHGYG